MGRRLNLSTPTVINTELIPLDESFYIEANGNTEQWYYDNTNVYAPNRNVIPLTLTPRLSVFDGDTKTTYTPTFFMVKWYAKEYNATQGEYVETQITTTDPAATDYVLSGNNLLVKKNVPYSHDVTIRCEATYVDPRDTGVTSTIQDTVTLLTNRDASTISPMLEIDCPASQGFNPLTATTSKYTLKGRASWGQDLANDNIVAFKADPLGTENIIPTNEDSIDSAAPTLSLRYGSINQADQTFMSRQTSGGQVGNIEGNVGYVTNIKGDTVKVMQLLPTTQTWTVYASSSGMTFTKTSYIEVMVSAESTLSYGLLYAKTNMEAPVNHIFVSTYDIKLAQNFTGNVVNNFNPSRVNGSVVKQQIDANAVDKTVTDKWQRIIYIVKVTSNTNNNQLGDSYLQVNGFSGSYNIKNACLFDLTKMFGSGNEPTTVAAFESWLATHIGTKSYYPYTEGRLINYGGYQVKMNQLVDANTTTVSTTSGHKYYANINNTKSVITSSGSAIAVVGGSDFVIDLTLMFGAGNEPDLEWCNYHFTEDYYPYHTGYDTNLLSVADEDLGIKTVGFNLWDEEWELGGFNTTTGDLTESNGIRSKNYIPVKPLTTYYFKASSFAWCALFDKDKNIIDASSVRTTHSGKCFSVYNNSFTTLSDAAFMKFYMVDSYGATYRNDICISLSSSKNGTYEPYWESFTDMSWVSKIGIENFNIWDEEWEVGAISSGVPEPHNNNYRSKDFCRCESSVDYYIEEPNQIFIFWYDSNKTYLSYSQVDSSRIVTSPNNACYFKVNDRTKSTYNHDICINKSIAHFNGRYYPHGVTAPYFPNGLCNVGSVYDEIKVVDGKIKGVVRLGCVDLGNFSYTLNYSDTYHVFMQNNAIPNAKTAISGGINAASSRFENKWWGYIASYSSNNADDVLCLNDTSMGINALVIRDTTYTDAATFKAAVAGVPLIYELQTPYEFEIDYPTKSLFEWYGISNNTEVKADTLPWYVDGQNTDTLTVDAMYGEEIRVVLRAKKNYGTDLYPSKAYRSILWRIPDIDSSVLSENGSAVRSDTESMNFGTIVNIKGDTLSDDVKKEHLRFHWKSRRDNTSTETDQGWGLTKELPASDLVNTRASASSRLASTIVYPEVYLLGAYEKVTDEGNDVTEDGELVYDRPVF